MKLPSALSGLGLTLTLAAGGGCGGGHIDPGFYGPTRGPDAGPSSPDEPERARREGAVPATVFVVWSSTCGACRTMDQAFYEALGPYRSDIDVVVLDVSDESTSRRAERAAREHGVWPFFRDFRGVTPTVLLRTRNGEAELYRGPRSKPEVWSRVLAELAAPPAEG